MLGECFHSFFEFSQTFITQCSYNSSETLSTCFPFLLENTATRKTKQLVNFDYVNTREMSQTPAVFYHSLENSPKKAHALIG